MYPVSYTHLYLQPVEVKPGRQSLDLGDNDDFDSFIRSRDVTAYDSSYAMFRWETDISSDMVSAQINGAGTVTDMTVTGRGAGGIASELSVSGSDGTVTVSYTHLLAGMNPPVSSITWFTFLKNAYLKSLEIFTLRIPILHASRISSSGLLLPPWRTSGTGDTA